MDIRTDFIAAGEDATADWSLADRDLASEAGLRTAVVISLFTDARAQDDDELPDGAADRRGWWGDVIAPASAPGDQPWRTGSRLWLLTRAKRTAETARRAEAYAGEALGWLVTLGVASTVQVSAGWNDERGNAAGWLDLAVEIMRPSGTPARFDLVWNQP